MPKTKTGMTKKEKQTVETFRRLSGPLQHPKSPPKGVTRWTNGIYANRCLDEEEKTMLEDIIARLHADFVLNSSSDQMQAEAVGIFYLKMNRALVADDLDAIQRLELMFRSSLKCLKATRIDRDNDVTKKSGESLAEWASALIAKADEIEKASQAKGQEKNT